MALFGKKKEEESGGTGVPTSQVLQFRKEGLSNNQIVQTLQRSGYRTDQIFDAMNQADLQSAAPLEGAVPLDQADMPPPPQTAPAYPEERPMSAPQPLSAPQPMSAPQAMAPPEQYPYPQPAPAAIGQGPAVPTASDERMEEIAEAIIEEKWQDLVKDVTKVVEWKRVVETRMTQLEQKTEDVKSDVQQLNKALFDRMDRYDKSVGKMGITVKAMEEVFRKTLPTLSESVSELSRLAGAKKKKAK